MKKKRIYSKQEILDHLYSSRIHLDDAISIAPTNTDIRFWYELTKKAIANLSIELEKKLEKGK
jgi:hypothetical protein